jgi:hypothetical protein
MSTIGVLAEESSTPTRVLLNLAGVQHFSAFCKSASWQSSTTDPQRVWIIVAPFSGSWGTIREATNDTQY